jgi:hypothetical protein
MPPERAAWAANDESELLRLLICSLRRFLRAFEFLSLPVLTDCRAAATTWGQ